MEEKFTRLEKQLGLKQNATLKITTQLMTPATMKHNSCMVKRFSRSPPPKATTDNRSIAMSVKVIEVSITKLKEQGGGFRVASGTTGKLQSITRVIREKSNSAPASGQSSGKLDNDTSAADSPNNADEASLAICVVDESDFYTGFFKASWTTRLQPS